MTMPSPIDLQKKAQPVELLLVLDAGHRLADVEQHLDPRLCCHVLLHVPVVGRQLLAKNRTSPQNTFLKVEV